MKVLKFQCGEPIWTVPLNELSAGLKRLLRMQWREFINELNDVVEFHIDPEVLAMLERTLKAN
ncbi:MAG: hypothetical protein K8F91_10275 [Candidatus Obscuribacterales bacterium]|nr:hypothetical protein [Candidatus Obscuribacterales bacterium]